MAHGAVGAQCWVLVQVLLGGISLQSHGMIRKCFLAFPDQLLTSGVDSWVSSAFGSAFGEKGRGRKVPSPAAELLNVGDAESVFLSTSPQTLPWPCL